jgi:hypothetical protein
MPRNPATILCDSTRGLSAADAGGDWHDVPFHHRYYGSSAFNGGERIIESRRGPRPRPAGAA